MTNIIEVNNLTEEFVINAIPVFVKDFFNKTVYFEIARCYKDSYHITIVSDDGIYSYNHFDSLSEAVEFFNNIGD